MAAAEWALADHCRAGLSHSGVDSIEQKRPREPMTPGLRIGAAMVCVAGIVACKAETRAPVTDSTSGDEPRATSAAVAGGASVSGARIAVPHAGPPGEWQMPAGYYASSRYSELSAITPQNATNLQLA